MGTGVTDTPCFATRHSCRQGVVYLSRVRVKAASLPVSKAQRGPRKGICQLAFAKNSKQASLGLPAVCQRGEWGENLGVMVAAFLLLVISPISEVRKGHFCSCASPALNEALWCPRVGGPEACSC